MWMYFFAICDALAHLIPGKKARENVRRIRLNDWRRKYDALRHAFPEMNFFNTRMVKGGWNIGFIVKNRYVFKVRKHVDINIPAKKITREKRITDALRPFANVQILNIDVVKLDGFTFYKYDFIPGRNLNTLPMNKIMERKNYYGHTIAEFIYKIHNARPTEINDLKTDDGDGWNHHDICNNIIVNPKTLDIIGIIDWEYAGWGPLETEIQNCTRFSKKLAKSGLDTIIRNEYKKLAKK